MEQKQEEQNCDFTNEQREILKETFKVGLFKNECKKESLEDIIKTIIDDIKTSDYYKENIQKYWFTKQIEKWKNDKRTNEDPEDNELMEMVEKDLKIRIANTMLALEKRTDIDKKNIWFYQNGKYVDVNHNDDKICQVSEFSPEYYHASPPYKPFFMKNQNDNDKLNGVCIYKHGKDENEDSKNKTKWIMACFNDDDTEPQCKITFKTDENDKITNVEIETAKDRNGDKSIYTISLNDKGQVGQITKKGEEGKDAYYIEEINNLLFKDETNKHLTENIECELDNRQKQVFDKIKEYLGVVKEEDIADNITNQQSNTGLKEANTRKWFGRYTDTDGHKYFSCCCFNIPLQ